MPFSVVNETANMTPEAHAQWMKKHVVDPQNNRTRQRQIAATLQGLSSQLPMPAGAGGAGYQPGAGYPPGQSAILAGMAGMVPQGFTPQGFDPMQGQYPMAGQNPMQAGATPLPSPQDMLQLLLARLAAGQR